MRTILLTSLFILSLTFSAQSQSISVETIQFGSGIDERNIVNVDSVFSSTIDRVYCFTTVTDAGESTTITHVWYRQDEEMARVELPVNGDRWRTWSSKYILKNWTGEWSVDVLDADGEVLATKTFRVEEAVANQ